MIGENIEKNPNIEKREDEAKIFRHSIAEYKLDESIIQSENPESPPKAKDQWFDSDLTPEGKKFAREKAEEFFDEKDPAAGELLMNPETDALYFVSGDFVRAAETAKIFLEVARERGFEIVPARKDDSRPPRNKAEEIGQGYIRKVHALTLGHIKNVLTDKIFQPNDYLKEKVKHPEGVSDETKAKWSQARAIIEADNKGTWPGNFLAHAEKIAKMFPEIKTAEEIYRMKFLRLIELAKFAQEKIKEANPDKNIKILGFSHENAFLYFLNKNFGEFMKNCESIGFKVEEGDKGVPRVLVTAKGKTIIFNG